MKLFVFESATRVSDNYHDGGGLLIVANDRADAAALIAEHNAEYRLKRTYEDQDEIVVSEADWDAVKEWEVPASSERTIITFPDAGCC